MEEEFPLRAEIARRRRRRLIQAMIALTIVAFVLGVGIAVLIGRSDLPGVATLFQSEQAQQAAAAPPPSPTPAPEPAATDAAAQEARQAAQRVEQVAEQQGGTDYRVAALEQRLARLDLQAQAAAGNAARAEALLITFAARRSIERGAPLGYLEDQLRLRFGDARPNAVNTIIMAARNPVTLDQLIARLDGLAPTLTEGPRNEGVVSRLSRELGELFVVRREDAPSPAAERRIERARMFLETGRISAAVQEVQRLPNAAAADRWLSDASRYAAAEQALELLETTAILEQRGLRDGSGAQVQQPSPAEASPGDAGAPVSGAGAPASGAGTPASGAG